MASEVLHPIYGCPCMHLLSQLTLNFPREEVLRSAEQQMHGVTSLEGQLSSARTSDLFTHVYYARPFIAAYSVNSLRARSALVLHEQTRIASCNQTRLDSAVILNSSETSGPLSNGRILKMYSLEVYITSFGGQKGGSSKPPRTPPAYGPGYGRAQSTLIGATNIQHK